MKLANLIIALTCVLTVGCNRPKVEPQPEIGSSRVAFEMRDEAQKEYQNVKEQIQTARGHLDELKTEFTRFSVVIESAKTSGHEALRNRDGLMADLKRLAESRDALAEQTRMTQAHLQELTRQTAQLRRDAEAIHAQGKDTRAQTSRKKREEDDQTSSPLSARVEIRTYGDATLRLPVGDGYIAAGRGVDHNIAAGNIARDAGTPKERSQVTEIREFKQQLKEYLRKQAIPDGYRVIEITQTDPAPPPVIIRARANGGYRPFYFPDDATSARLYVELYVDPIGRRSITALEISAGNCTICPITGTYCQNLCSKIVQAMFRRVPFLKGLPAGKLMIWW